MFAANIFRAIFPIFVWLYLSAYQSCNPEKEMKGCTLFQNMRKWPSIEFIFCLDMDIFSQNFRLKPPLTGKNPGYMRDLFFF